MTNTEQFYTVYKDDEKVGSHLTEEEAKELEWKIDKADSSWWNRPHIRIISEQEDKKQENTKNAIIGKDFIRLNTENGHISKMKIKEAWRDAYDFIHICGDLPRTKTSYTYTVFQNLLRGGYNYDADSIISLGMGGIKKYMAKQKDAYDKLNASIIQYELNDYYSKFGLEDERIVVKKKQNRYDKRRRGCSQMHTKY